MNRQKIWIAMVGLLAVGLFSQATFAQSLVWDASGERNGVIMESTYTELYFGDQCDQVIEVRVWNAPPNIRLKIFVRDWAIGVLQTNEDGYGRFFKGRRNVPLDGDDRPDAPRVEDGDIIKVGQLRTNKFITGEFQPR